VVSTLDHFAWDAVPSPQLRDLPFAVTLRAQDAANQTLTNYQRCVGLSGRGVQVTNSIGSAGSTIVFPMGTGANVERSQIIYGPRDVGGNGFITALSLNIATIPSQSLNNWTIRMKHTPLSSYSSYIWENTGWTVVCQTNSSVLQTGWVTFNFSTPFDYNGVDNLLILA